MTALADMPTFVREGIQSSYEGQSVCQHLNALAQEHGPHAFGHVFMGKLYCGNSIGEAMPMEQRAGLPLRCVNCEAVFALDRGHQAACGYRVVCKECAPS